MAGIFERVVHWLYPEQRQLAGGSSAINSALTSFDDYYDTLGAPNIYRTGAVAFGLGEISRAFMTAEPQSMQETLTPAVLSMMARTTMARGNSVWEIASVRGRVTLRPVGEYDIVGGVDPDSWAYRVEYREPRGNEADDETRIRAVRADNIVHVRYNPWPERPWVGISPLSECGITSEQLAYIENSLKMDASQPGGGIMPIPDGTTSRQFTQVKTAMSTGKGAITPVETTSAGFGQGALQAPKNDWAQVRFGAMVPQHNLALRQATNEIILGALGVPPGLLAGEAGMHREAYRKFWTNTIQPLAKLIEAELSEKLETDISIYLPEVLQSDISARERAWKGFIEGGMEPDDAARVVYLPEGLIVEKPEPVAPNPVDNNGNIPATSSGTNGNTPAGVA